MNKHIPYIFIIGILVFLLFHNNKEKEIITNTKIDTVIVEKHVIDSIPGDVVYVSTKIDTSIWIKKAENIPDTTYKGLLSQYKLLGNNYFSTTFDTTQFNIEGYGHIIVKDSVSENRLKYTKLYSFLTFPEKTITITEKYIPKRELYFGPTIYVNNPSVNLSLILKTKKEKLYGFSIGWNKKPQYGFSYLYKIKIN